MSVWEPKPWEPKPWGATRPVFENQIASVFECQTKRGGFSSVHYHEAKENVFLITGGAVAVVWFSAWVLQRRVLRIGESLAVPPLVPHQFQVIETGGMIEVYTQSGSQQPVERRDICRLTDNGNMESGWQSGVSPVFDEAMELFAADLRESNA